MTTMKHLFDVWASVYANHSALRTAVEFLHVAGLVGGGGYAIVVDRSTLSAARATGAARTVQLSTIRDAHRIVIGGLVVLFVTGVLLFAADIDTFLASRVFWLKMGLVALLLGNGAIMRMAQQQAERGAVHAWPRLRATAAVSLLLWFLTILAGTALPNIG
jgi:hypothetical protein